MQKAIVIGSPGAGKSTFARALRDVTGLPLYYLDMLWHRPDQTTVSEREFDEKLHVLLSESRWIIDGNYSRTLEMRLKYCDTVFLLDYPLELCLSGVESRIGKAREDLPWHETEFDREFRQYIMDFPRERLPQIYALLAKYQGSRDIFIFKSREESTAFLAHIKKSCREQYPRCVLNNSADLKKFTKPEPV